VAVNSRAQRCDVSAAQHHNHYQLCKTRHVTTYPLLPSL
jgi:hypothetical protein